MPVVIVTLTGAWSQPPVAAGSVGFTSTVMVGFADPELLLLFDDGVVATVPTDEMTPGVVASLGRVIVTLAPTATSDC